MDELKKLLLELFESKKYYTENDLRKKLKIKGEEQTNIFNNALNELIEDGSLFFDEKEGYTLMSNKYNLAYGTLEINKQGNGFVHTKDNHTIFISSNELNGALNKDKVIVSDIDLGRKTEYVGSIFRIVKRNNGKAFFEVIKNNNTFTFVPYNYNYNINIDINKNDKRKLVDGDIIEVKIGKDQIDKTFNADLIDIVGHVNDPDLDLKVLAKELSIEIDFSLEELEEAKNIKTEVTDEDKVGRIDLTHLNFITIDCDNTKDKDDAVYLEKLKNGNYKLYTSISSVNYYIKRGTKLFDCVKRRSTSHYPNDTCIPMLPHSISNGICSLNENEERLTKTCEMEIDKNGKVIDYQIYNSVIKSKKSMCYSKVNKVLSGIIVPEYNEYKDMLINMYHLSKILNDANEKRNYLNFNILQTEVLNEDGVNKFVKQPRGNAEKLIENFMVITNVTIGNHYSWMPFIYRIHEKPNERIFLNVIKKMNSVGFKINENMKISNGTVKNLLNKFNKKEECEIFNEILLRAMKKAKYSTDDIGHFALNFKYYCHFTSPIRRSADFMIHSIIDEMENGYYNENNIKELEEELSDVCKHASSEEVNDMIFEEEAKKMAMAIYMENHLNEEFNATITEVYPHGLFVRTDELIEGKIKLDDIYDDKYKYRYNKDSNCISSSKQSDIFKIGDKVLVKSLTASKENRTINFSIEKKKS